jgi:hypothetical protein
MKKIAFLLLLAFGTLSYANAAQEDEMMYTTMSTSKTSAQMCEEVG